MTYVPAIYSMRNTRCQQPADDGRRAGFDHLPIGWNSAALPSGKVGRPAFSIQ
ncbi:MAG: hypothetical protein HRF45_10760 [Fimbriimonadia bacterium]|jgi:hypothetical protein